MPELSHCRVAAIVTDGFEESELVEPLRALHKAGADVDLISPGQDVVQGFRHLEKGIRLSCDKKLSEADPSDYDALFLPGGVTSCDALRQNADALAFVTAIEHAGKPIAFICHAAWILISAGLVARRTLTGFHTIREDIRNAGGDYVNQAVVVDNNWVSSRSPADLSPFIREMITSFGSFVSQRAA